MTIHRIHHVGRWALLASLPLCLGSCIDEDLSRCGADYAITYTVRLHTNMQTEVDEAFPSAQDQPVADQLRLALCEVFTDVAHDLDLSFYQDHQLSHHESHVVNANTSSFTIYLPINDYRHLALANTAEEPAVTLSGTDSDLETLLSVMPTDTVDSQVKGLFTAREDMRVASQSQSFDVDLYMQNCAAALVIDTNDVPHDEVFAYVVGFGTDFSVSDSLYTHARKLVTRTSGFQLQRYRCLYAAGFPSVDQATGMFADGGLWEVHAYVRRGDTYTETILSLREPLRAGQLKVVKAFMKADGSLGAEDPQVGVSVNLNWKPGGNYDVEI